MEQAGVGSEIGTPRGRYVAAKVRIAVERLLALDDLWTAELERASGYGPLSEPEVEILVTLGEEMQASLSELTMPLDEFREMFRYGPDVVVNSAFAAIVELSGLPPHLAEEIRADPDTYELRGAVIEACDHLLAEAGEESRVLAEKLSRISEGGEVPPGDLRPAFRCALVLAGVGAGVALSIFDGGATVTVALNVALDAGKGVVRWITNDCPRRLPGIRFRRGGQ